jgi:hypothetical protein
MLELFFNLLCFFEYMLKYLLELLYNLIFDSMIVMLYKLTSLLHAKTFLEIFLC